MPATHEAPYSTAEEERFSDDRLQQLVGDLVERNMLLEGKPFAMAVVDGTDPAADLGRAVEYKKFEAVFDNDYKLMEDEYGPYDATSTFLVVADMQRRMPAGVFRLIHNGPNGLKTVNDIANPAYPWNADMLATIDAELRSGETPLDPAKVLDVATLARAQEYDVSPVNKLISSALYRYTRVYALQLGYKDLVTIFDTKPFDSFQRAFAAPWMRIPSIGPASYLDSPESVPLYLDLQKYDERVDREHPDIKEFLEHASSIAPYIQFPEQT